MGKRKESIYIFFIVVKLLTVFVVIRDEEKKTLSTFSLRSNERYCCLDRAECSIDVPVFTVFVFLGVVLFVEAVSQEWTIFF